VASLIYFIYRLRIQRLLAVERVRSQISRDLHDEIGSSLSSVQIMSAFAEQSMEGSSPDARQWVSRISGNTREMTEKIRDIVWTLNSPDGISGNIITRMNQYISHTLEPKDIGCNFTADEKVNEALNDFMRKRNVYLIFKEAVNNAAKYASCTQVDILLKIENKKIFMSVHDNGIGFDMKLASKGNGLTNMSKRAAQMNARLEIKSAAGSGTALTLILPVPQLRYGIWKKAG
jgi:signal transduction histidine kinase